MAKFKKCPKCGRDHTFFTDLCPDCAATQEPVFLSPKDIEAPPPVSISTDAITQRPGVAPPPGPVSKRVISGEVTQSGGILTELTKMIHKTCCAECGKEIKPHYCSDACRLRAHRKRKKSG